jgi:biotin carboxylase
MDSVKRVLLLTTAHSYRGAAFLAAAERLGVEVVQAVDMPQALAGRVPLAVDFGEQETAVHTILTYAQAKPLAAILPLDDSGVLIAARASQQLGLPHNSPLAAEAARDKLRMRQLLQAGGVPVPAFQGFDITTETSEITAVVREQIGFPCVVKPRTLNGSRGVIRANDEEELTAVVTRVKRLLQTIGATGFLVEGFIPGFEVALEGVLVDGRLQLLALFDKPDPLDGPFFEETIYVTPSRLPVATQEAIAEMTAKGASAIGLQTGSVHAELRLNERGVWIVEVNGRSIGGLCSQTLRFDMNMSLEELILRQAVGLDIGHLQREQKASGVMMIPIPRPGILRGYSGTDEAKAIPGIDDVTITVPLNNRIVALPEGESYLGFIFASGETPAFVEEVLRRGYGRLHFEIDEEIPLSVVRNP